MMYYFIDIQEPTPLTAEELRILNVVLAGYSDELKEEGLNLEIAIADNEQPITKERVVSCLKSIKKHDLANILARKRGKRIKYYACLLG